MIRIRQLMFASSFVAVALTATTGGAQGAVKEEELPETVAKTFRTAFPNAEIQKLTGEEENGIVVYDFEFKDGDVERETDIAAEGTMLEVTLVVAAKAVPAAAMKTIKASSKGATIKRLEEIEMTYTTLDGKVVKLPAVTTKYAAEMVKRDATAEVVVKPDGTVIEKPEWVKIAAKPAVKSPH